MALCAGMHEDGQAQGLAGSHQNFVLGDDVGVGNWAHGKRRRVGAENAELTTAAAGIASRVAHHLVDHVEAAEIVVDQEAKHAIIVAGDFAEDGPERRGRRERRRQLRALPAAPDRQS